MHKRLYNKETVGWFRRQPGRRRVEFAANFQPAFAAAGRLHLGSNLGAACAQDGDGPMVASLPSTHCVFGSSRLDAKGIYSRFEMEAGYEVEQASAVVVQQSVMKTSRPRWRTAHAIDGG